MESFALIMTIIGAVSFLCAVVFDNVMPKHTDNNVGRVPEPKQEQADDAWWRESWWREIFDYWD